MKMNPKKALEYYSRIYPFAWKQADRLRAGRGKELPFWPEWCFLPLAGAYATVTTEAANQKLDIANEKGFVLMNDVGIIGALAAWRVTQGVYRFDPDVYQAVIDTPITGDLPHEVLFNLPEWCIYVETPGLNFSGEPMVGFFAFLEYDVNTTRKELRFVMDYTNPGAEFILLKSHVIHLGPWPLLESIERAMKEAERVSKSLFGFDYSFSLEIAKQVHGGFAPLVSLLLYICSANGEIGDGDRKPVRPRSKKTKKGLRMFPPQQVATWDVGVRMGAALRKARALAPRDSFRDGGCVKERARPRSHVRRAHWHGYWIGPRDGERKFILKWVSPILVGGGDDLPVTIRPVE